MSPHEANAPASAPIAPARHRVLLLAEVAHPDLVSVPLIGWCMSEALFRHADVHLVTHVRNREAIARHGLREGRDFTVIDTDRLVRGLFRVADWLGASNERGWTIHTALSPIGCYAFEFAAWRCMRGALEQGRFDLVHRLTPVSPTTPSIFGRRLRKLGIPFVVGPWNGGLRWPDGFADRMHREREWLSRLRRAHRLLPGYADTRRCAAAILAGSFHTLSEIPRSDRSRSIYLPENGIAPERFGRARQRRATLPLRGAFLGRLVPYKCADVLVEAAADLLRAGKLHLDIIGDGPERSSLEALIARLDLGRSVTMHGFVEHRRVQDLLVDCDFLACPSIREFGGGVVLEAMALGVAPIVADYGGPSELVDMSSGIRVPFTTSDDLKAGFERTFGELVETPGILDALGAAARDRVARLFTWDRKAEQMLRVYDWAIHGGEKPDLLNSVPKDGRPADAVTGPDMRSTPVAHAIE